MRLNWENSSEPLIASPTAGRTFSPPQPDGIEMLSPFEINQYTEQGRNVLKNLRVLTSHFRENPSFPICTGKAEEEE